jgi:uncharacterized membrane protein YidH (DUF202 family)
MPIKPDADSKSMISRSFSIVGWLVRLVDPPPLDSMSLAQKAGRVVLITATLIVGSILVAMFGALGLFLVERGRELRSKPEFLDGLWVITIGIAVNTICVLVLVQIKKADHKLVPPKH